MPRISASGAIALNRLLFIIMHAKRHLCADWLTDGLTEQSPDMAMHIPRSRGYIFRCHMSRTKMMMMMTAAELLHKFA